MKGYRHQAYIPDRKPLALCVLSLLLNYVLIPCGVFCNPLRLLKKSNKMKSYLPTVLFTPTAQAKMLVERQINTHLVIRSGVLEIAACIAQLQFGKQGPHTQGKTNQSVCAIGDP